MGTWLMKFEVEADLGIEPSLGELVFKHPQGLFEVHLENHQMEPGCKSPSLHAYFLFQADGLVGRFLNNISTFTRLRSRPSCTST